MAGETFLLSGDQIATFANAKVTYPDGKSTITLHGVQTLGDENSRFFLVRTQGSSDQVVNGDFYEVYAAVSDGCGGLKPAASPIVSKNYATPDGYNNTAAGDSYNIFGLFGGTKFAIDLNGFQDTHKYTVVQGQDRTGGDFDGEMDLDEIRAANPDMAVCFTRGTMLDTPEGETAIERLKVGDQVTTADHGPQQVRWIGCTRITLTPDNRHLRPVRIGKNAFGPAVPGRDVVVSPAHRVLLQGAGCQLYLGEDEALTAARFLVNGGSIQRDETCETVEYWHLLFDRHEIVTSSGLASESFHPGDYAVTGLGRDLRRELFELFPNIAPGQGPTSKTARRTTRAYESRVVAVPLSRAEYHA